MEKVIKNIILGFALTIIIFLSIIYLRYLYVDYKEKQIHEDKQIGKYILDIVKTDMGSYNKEMYKNLFLNIYKNGQFEFNISAPFIYKTKGYWEAHGAGLEWNRLFFDKKGPYIEISQCCNLDSTIIINGLYPKDGQENIQEIYFKKIKPNKNDLD